jgi:hypothetical protein
MKGLLLKLKDDQTGAPGVWFWRLFEPIRPELDRLFWCFPRPPWMGDPPDFREDVTAWATFEVDGVTDTMLWRSGSLGRYAERFAEESIELWGIDPLVHDPQRIAALYDGTVIPEMNRVIEPYAEAWLLYTDCTSWELYANEMGLLHRVQEHLSSKDWVQIVQSDSSSRGTAFRAAGLPHAWLAGVAEADAPPNCGPVTRSGNSEVTEGPPSVS